MDKYVQFLGEEDFPNPRFLKSEYFDVYKTKASMNQKITANCLQFTVLTKGP